MLPSTVDWLVVPLLYREVPWRPARRFAANGWISGGGQSCGRAGRWADLAVVGGCIAGGAVVRPEGLAEQFLGQFTDRFEPSVFRQIGQGVAHVLRHVGQVNVLGVVGCLALGVPHPAPEHALAPRSCLSDSMPAFARRKRMDTGMCSLMALISAFSLVISCSLFYEVLGGGQK